MKNKKLFAILTLVCFMFTLMPVAAFAANEANVNLYNSYIYEENQRESVSNEVGTTDGVVFVIEANDSDETTVDGAEVLVWAEDANGDVAHTTAKVGTTSVGDITGLYDVYEATQANDGKYYIRLFFATEGEYTVYAGIAKKGVTVDSVNDISKFKTSAKITVRPAATEDPEYFYAKGDNNGANIVGATAAVKGSVSDKEHPVAEVSVDANGVASKKVSVTFNKGVENNDTVGTVLKNKDIYIESTSAAVTVNKAKDNTKFDGTIDFTVAGTIEGIYYVELTFEGVTWFVEVTVGDTGAAYIETVAQPTAPQALYDDLDRTHTTASGTENCAKIRFSITDINGNVVEDGAKGMEGIEGNKNGGDDFEGKYVVLTEAPVNTTLESEDLTLDYCAVEKLWYLDGVNTLDVEGKYAVKVILDNGATATAEWEVKKFQTPVMLVIGTSTDVVELGGTIGGELLYVDANGVQKAAKDADFVATGYAVLDAEKADNVNTFSVTAKNDEKYVGATIVTTAVSERYNLVATKEFKVADGAVALSFVDKTAEVNVNNKITWNVVDSQGVRVALGEAINRIDDIKYVVLDKPEDAKVTVRDISLSSELIGEGIGKMALTSNKVGNVTVQAILKVTYPVVDVAGANTQQDAQVKYYTGTQIFAVGTAGVGDVVVMSIGSNEIIINDAKATIDAAPIVENNRTFVPFRALAEAFGATVAYDEATQAVTAELNGVTVVMTIGSAEYTVNGEAKTADVAPFINGSRTMVPVRFAAEAFGIKVIPTYDENGATADILFNL